MTSFLSGRRIIILLASLVLLSLWLAFASSFRNLPLYADSLFTVGAGARLASEGHFAVTFMPYGMLNPYVLEALFRSGLGEAAPDVLRLVNFLACLGTVWLLASGVGRITGEGRTRVLPVTAITVLSSSILLVESMELTPEILTLFALSGMIRACFIYERGLRGDFRLAVWMALVAGARPTAVILWLPALLAVAARARPLSWLNRIWMRWVPAVCIAAAVLMAFPGIISREGTTVAAASLALLLTAACVVRDLRAGYRSGWKDLLFTVAGALAVTAVLFPHYVVFAGEIARQVGEFGMQILPPANSAGIFVRNGLLGLGYLLFVLPGPLAAVGLVSYLCIRIRRRTASDSWMPPVLMGFLPFFILVMRDDSFSPRYLVPLSVLVLVPAVLGLLRLIGDRRLGFLLLLPLAICVFQLYETASARIGRGGILDAFRAIPEAAETVAWGNVFPCDPKYYEPEGLVSWPLVPYVAYGTRLVQSTEMPSYAVGYGTLPAGYGRIGEWGIQGTERFRWDIRRSASPYYAKILQLYGYPWTWRAWCISSISMLGRAG